MLRAGQLRHRLTVQAATQTRDAYGEWVTAWVEEGAAWADVFAKSGQERALAGASQGVATFSIRMRPVAGLTTEHRLLWGERVLGITFIDDTVPGELRLDALEITGREAL